MFAEVLHLYRYTSVKYLKTTDKYNKLNVIPSMII